MNVDYQRSVSLRTSRRAERNNQNQQTEDVEGEFFPTGKWSQDYPMKITWRRGFLRLVLAEGILWMFLIPTVLVFHVWSCQSSLAFFSAMCNRGSRVLIMLDTMGLVPGPPHRCLAPVADDPEKIIIPKRTPSEVVEQLTYITEDVVGNNGSSLPPLFGGHQSWLQRDESFELKSSMKVHCGFMRGGGVEMATKDIRYAENCRFVVASGIFDRYDTPHQPSDISPRSQKLFCFLMAVDEISTDFIKKNVTVREDKDGGQWVGIWRLIVLKNPPYDEPRRNGKVPKILTHRLFPQAQYSIWIDDTCGMGSTHLPLLSTSIIAVYMRRLMQTKGGSDMLDL